MPNLGSRLTGIPIDTRGGKEGDGLVVRSGVLVNERVAVPSGGQSYITTAHHNTTQSIADSTWVSLDLNTEDVDDRNWHSTSSNTSRITVDLDGTYMVTGQGSINKGAETQVSVMVRILVDGTTETMRSGEHIPASSVTFTNFYPQVSDTLTLVSGQYVEVQVFQNNGGASALNTIADRSRLTVMRLNEGTHLSGFSPILDHKPTSDTLDDEFDSTTLDAKWTAVSGSSGTIDPFEVGEVNIYDLTTRSGWLLIQAGNDGTNIVSLRQDLTLGDGESVLLAISPSILDDANLANNEQQIGIALNDNDTEYSSGNRFQVYCVTNPDTDQMNVETFDGSVLVFSEHAVRGMVYLRISRIGLTYWGWFSQDGSNWSLVSSDTAGGALTNLWIFCNNAAAGTDPVPIHAVHWIRQGINALDPWSHSPLITLKDVFLGRELLTRPPSIGWSWVNQGSATETVLSDGSILMDTPAVGTTNLLGRVRSYTAPLKVRARLDITGFAGNSGGTGLWFRESSTGELHAFYYKDIAADFLAMENWNSATSFGSTPFTASKSRGSSAWLEIEDDNTDLFFRISSNGYEGTYLQVGTVGRTSFMAGGPDEWGWFIRDHNQLRNSVLSSWLEI